MSYSLWWHMYIAALLDSLCVVSVRCFFRLHVIRFKFSFEDLVQG